MRYTVRDTGTRKKWRSCYYFTHLKSSSSETTFSELTATHPQVDSGVLPSILGHVISLLGPGDGA